MEALGAINRPIHVDTDIGGDIDEPPPAELRSLASLAERKPGTFYRKRDAFLHFHEDPAGIFADLKEHGTFVRLPATSPADQAALLNRIRRLLE